MAQRPDRVQRQWRLPSVVPVAIALVGCAVLVVLVATSGDDEATVPRSSSTTAPAPTSASTTEPPPEPVDLAALTVEPFPEDAPDSYRIVYDIEENAVERQERWTVRRPYESLIEGLRDDVLVSGSATSRTGLSTYVSDRDGWFPVQPELHRASFDQRPLAAMATMVALGFADMAGDAEYAGTACTVFLTGPPVSGESLGPASDSEQTETCIDGRGLVLHERWEINGRLVSERTASSVEIDPAVPAEAFDPRPRITDAPELATLLASVAVPADEETVAGLRTDVAFPADYELDGAVFRANTSDASAIGATETVRFYSDGADLVEVAEVTVSGPAELGGNGALPLTLEGFEEVKFLPGFRVSVIRARLNDTSFVEIRGTDPGLLVELLRAITLR